MYNTPNERKISMDIQILLFIQENILHFDHKRILFIHTSRNRIDLYVQEK